MTPIPNVALAKALLVYIALSMTPLLLFLTVGENSFLLASAFFVAGCAGLFFSVKALRRARVARREVVHVRGPCRARAQARLATVLAITALLGSLAQFLLVWGSLLAPLAR